MSDPSVGRRGLLRGLFRPASAPLPARPAPPLGAPPPAPQAASQAAPQPARFSLEAFYAAREAPVGGPTLPRVPMRPGLPGIETTGVGLCPPIEHLDPARPASDDEERVS